MPADVLSDAIAGTAAVLAFLAVLCVRAGGIIRNTTFQCVARSAIPVLTLIAAGGFIASIWIWSLAQ